MRKLFAAVLITVSATAMAEDIVEQMARDVVFIECHQNQCVEFETGVPIDTKDEVYPDGITGLFLNKEYTDEQMRAASKRIVEEFHKRYGK